jgi:hypothetical protein
MGSRDQISTLAPWLFSNGAGAHFSSNQRKLDDTLLVRWTYNYFYLSRGAFCQFDNEYPEVSHFALIIS